MSENYKDVRAKPMTNEEAITWITSQLALDGVFSIEVKRVVQTGTGGKKQFKFRKWFVDPAESGAET